MCAGGGGAIPPIQHVKPASLTLSSRKVDSLLGVRFRRCCQRGLGVALLLASMCSGTCGDSPKVWYRGCCKHGACYPKPKRKALEAGIEDLRSAAPKTESKARHILAL